MSFLEVTMLLLNGFKISLLIFAVTLLCHNNASAPVLSMVLYDELYTASIRRSVSGSYKMTCVSKIVSESSSFMTETSKAVRS